MANRDNPAGLVPVAHYAGGEMRANEYAIAGGLGSNIFNGDPVKSTGTGKQIDVAAAGDRMLGVFAGCQYEDPQGNVVYSPYWPTGQAVKTGTVPRCWVFDDPGILFKCQTVTGTAFTAAMIGATADLIINAGDTATGKSRVEVNIAGSDLGVKIIDYIRRPDNEIAEHCDVLFT